MHVEDGLVLLILLSLELEACTSMPGVWGLETEPRTSCMLGKYSYQVSSFISSPYRPDFYKRLLIIITVYVYMCVDTRVMVHIWRLQASFLSFHCGI